jgi:hypothetical protein
MEQKLRLVQGGSLIRTDNRGAERRPLAVPGQIVWKDARGATQMASVVTRNVSDTGLAVEPVKGPAIPLYRMVYFQVDRSARQRPDLPPALRGTHVLSAVFRVGDTSPRTGAPTEYALRMLIEPDRRKPVAAKATWGADPASKTA